MKEFLEKMSTERATYKSELTNDIANLKTTITELVKTGVKDEIDAAIRPLEEKQNTMIEEQKSMVNLHKNLADKVFELEIKLKSSPSQGKDNSPIANQATQIVSSINAATNKDKITLNSK